MKHFKHKLLLALLTVVSFTCHMQAQVTIGDGTPPNNYSILEIVTTATQGGLRLPHLTTAERDALKNASAAFDKDANRAVPFLYEGLTIYNTDTRCVEYYNAEKWISMCQSSNNFKLSPDPGIFDKDGEQKEVIVANPACDMTGSYNYLVIAGVASISPESSTDGKFVLVFPKNNSAFERKTVVLVSDPCGNSATFVFTQAAGVCPGLHNDPVLNATTGKICSQGMFYMYITNPQSAANYIWVLNNVQVNTGLSYQTNIAGTYQVYTDMIGCGTPATVILTAENTTAPNKVGSVTASNAGVLCTGGGVVTLTALNYPAGTILWYKDGIKTAHTGTTVTLTSAADLGDWFAVMYDGGDCYSQPSNTISVIESSSTALPLPDFTINGASDLSTIQFCKSGLLELEVTTDYSSILGVTYQWYANGVEIGSPSPLPIHYVIPNLEDNMYFSVMVTKNGYCSASASSADKAITLTASGETNINANNTTYICGSNQAILQAAIMGAQEYYWYSYDETATISTKIATTASNQYFTSTPGKYRVAYKDVGGCVSKMSSPISVIQSNSITMAFTNLPTLVNNGDVVTFSTMATPTPESYEWSVNNGAKIIGSTSGALANIEFVNTGATIVSVKAKNGCGEVTKETTVHVQNLCTDVTSVSLTPASNFTIMEGVSYDLTATANGTDMNRTYNWFVDGVSVQNGTSNQYNFTQPIAGSYTVYVQVTNCSGAQATSQTLTASVTPDLTQYQDYTGAAFYIIGRTCYDVNMVNNTGECSSTTHQRINDFASTYNFDYNFIGTGQTNLIFALDDGAAITNGIATNTTVGTLSFKADLGIDKDVNGVRDLAKGTDNTTAKSVIVYAAFIANGLKYKTALPVKIKDCFCCGEMGSVRSVTPTANTYNTHLYDGSCWMMTYLKEPGTAVGVDYARGFGRDMPGGWIYQGTLQAEGVPGYFYKWTTAKTVCPAGWHLPTKEESAGIVDFITKETSKNENRRGANLWFASSMTTGYFTPWDGYSNNVWASWPMSGYWYDQAGRGYMTFSNKMTGRQDLAAGYNGVLTVRCVKDN